MARLDSWLSPDILHALGWALIHSLWQCLACAAVAAVLMALSRRPSVRYLIGVGALAAMLAMPVATFFALMTAPAAPVMVSNTPVGGQPIVQSPAAAPVPVALQSRVESKSVTESWSVMLVREENRLPSINLLPWLVAAWLCGVTFFSGRLAGGFLLLEHKRRSQSTIPGAAILALCQEVQRQLGLDRAIEFLECNWLQTPAVIGWIRPAVLLPITALTGLSEAQLRAVIAHELAHIRRFDLLVNLFQVLVETLLFYHPAVWWLNKRIRAERELCCDEIAVAASGNRLEYARALSLMAEWESAPRLAMAINRGSLTERVFHILGRKSASAGQRMLGLTGSILFLVAALAAANALFVVAAPPIAQARESVKAVLSAGQATVAHLAQQVFQASEPATKSPSPQTGSDSNVPEAASNDVQRQSLSPPAVNLSGLPAIENLPTPTMLASSAAPNAKPGDQPVIAPAATETSAANASGPKTEAGIRCLLGLGPEGCRRQFDNLLFHGNITYCVDQNWHEDACPWGALESIAYLGTNVTGDEVYSARFMHGNRLYVLRPPNPDGKIEIVWPGWGDPNNSPSKTKVASPASPVQILYTRPAEWRGSSAANASGPKTEAGLRCLLGLEPEGCEARFENPSKTRQVIINCVDSPWSLSIPDTVGGPRAKCALGPLERVEYLGTNTAGDDVYSVKFMHENDTYVLPQPAPDGKIAMRCLVSGQEGISRCFGSAFVASSMARVTSPAGQARILYTRPSGNGEPAPTVSSEAAANAVVMPNTPTGAGDPNAVVCRAPQHIPNSDQFGPQVCQQNSEWWKVAMNGKDIGPDGKGLIDRPTVKYPKGEGDPDAITCRTPQILDNGATIARYGPVVCRPNRFWADLIKNRQIVDKHGVIVKLPRGVDYGPSYGPGGYPSNGEPGYGVDSGQPSQSSATQGSAP